MLRDDAATVQVYALIIALVIFMGALGSLLLFGSVMAEDTGDNEDAIGSVRSDNLADFLVGSPGVGWEFGADNVGRIGFANASGPGLDQGNLDLLRGASFVSDPANERVDYEDALESLGLDNSTGFHIRMAPVALREVLISVDLSHLRTGYVGDWEELSNYTVLDVVDDEQQIRLAQDEINTTSGEAAKEERAAVTALGVGFNDRVYITDPGGPEVTVDLVLQEPLLDDVGMAEIDGDVYPDDKGYLDDVLPNRIGLYDVLFIGSEVDQNTLTSNAIKDAIKDWVLAGGTLIVMGTGSQNVQWIQPLFSVGTTTVNGGAYANDPSHPALWEPNALDWTSYDNHGYGWNIKDTGGGGDYDKFIHIVQEDGEDLLAISREGAFGDGRIYLTTFRPGEIAQEQGLGEALGFVENMILYHDRSHLFLEYGPEVPQDAAIHVAIRQSFIWDYDLGQVPVRLEVLAWRV